MTSSGDLFYLVKSLSGPEKRYFRIHSSQGKNAGRKGYLLLFDALDEQTNFDETALKKKLARAPFSRRFSAVKSYLFSAILRSLRNYHAEENLDRILQNRLTDAAELQNKGILRKAEHAARGGLSLALRHEKFLMALQFNYFMRRMLPDLVRGGKTEDRAAKLIREGDLILRKLKNLSEYEHLRLRMMQATARFGEIIKGREKTGTLNRIVHHELLSSPRRALSFRALVHYHSIWYQFYANTNRYEDAVSSNLKLLKAFERRPAMMGEQLAAYMRMLSGIIYCSGKIRNYSLAATAISKERVIMNSLRSAAFGDKDTVAATATFYHSEFNVFIRTCAFDRAIETAGKLTRFIGLHRRQLSPELWEVHKYNSALACFITGRYSNAMAEVNSVINLRSKGARADVLSAAMILNLLIHFERGNETYLMHTLRSAYRYFYKKRSRYRTEEVILRFIRETAEADNRIALVPHFIRLRTELDMLARDPAENAYLEAIFLRQWIESKIRDCTMGELLRQEYEASENGKTPIFAK